MPYHDSPWKNQFIGTVLAGQSIVESAQQHQIPYLTTSELWHKFVQTRSTHAQPCSGRPQTVTPCLMCHLILESKKEHWMPLQDLSHNIGSQVSASTVCWVLNKEGRHRRKAWKVILLTKKHRKAWKAWATQYKAMTKEDWWCVIWSDKCYVYSGDKKGTVWVTLSADEVFHETVLYQPSNSPLFELWSGGTLWRARKGHWLCWTIQEVTVVVWQQSSIRIRSLMAHSIISTRRCRKREVWWYFKRMAHLGVATAEWCWVLPSSFGLSWSQLYWTTMEDLKGQD